MHEVILIRTALAPCKTGLLHVDGVAEALATRLQGTGSGGLYVPAQPQLRVLFHAHMSSGQGLIAHVGVIVNFLFRAHAALFAV